MKNFYVLIVILLFSTISIAQVERQVEVNEQTYSLIEEIDGELTLLYNIIDDEYRYFIQKGDPVIELKNTKVDGKYQMEYRQQLADLTAGQNLNAERVKFVLYSLETFVND